MPHPQPQGFLALPAADHPPLEAQLRILWRRARVSRSARALSAASALAAALLVILIFMAAITGLGRCLTIR
ncbi:MAG TPA: DUF2721 domain-containing protein [Anaerolineales bacterium]|nr:DUF2721 domain-containing protein [Anaerolineales bacterium]